MGAAGSRPSTLGDAADRSFVVCRLEQPAAEVSALLARLRPRFVLVPLGGDEAHVADTTLVRLHLSLSRAATLGEALPADAREPTPRRDGGLPLRLAPARCLVVDGDRLLGVYDSDSFLGPHRGADGVHDRLTVDHEPRIEAGATTRVYVSLEEDELLGTLSRDLRLEVGTEVTVSLKAHRRLAVVGARRGALRVSREMPAPLCFELRGTEIGTGRAVLDAFAGDRFLARLHLALEVTPVATDRSGSEDAPSVPRSRKAAWLEPAGDSRIDLCLFIEEEPLPEGGVRLTYRLRTADGSPAAGPLPTLDLSPGTEERIGRFLRSCEALEERALEAKGCWLFQTVFPPEVQDALWRHRDRVRSVQILSEQVSIPWEVCRLVGPVDGEQREGGFLCETFRVARWLYEAGAPRTLGAAPGRPTLGLIRGKGFAAPEAAIEGDALLDLLPVTGDLVDVPSNLTDVLDALSIGRHCAYHFMGHGMADDEADAAVFPLESGTPLEAAYISGTVQLARRRPLVFLNACETGRNGDALTGKGGWAVRFLNAGAGAFVGGLWRVRSAAAGLFAAEVYRRLFAGEVIAEAVRQARRAVREAYPGQPCWLAYTLFAHPLATWAGAAGDRPDAAVAGARQTGSSTISADTSGAP